MYLILVYCPTVQHTAVCPLIYYIILALNSLNLQYHQMFAHVKTVAKFCKFTLGSAQ